MATSITREEWSAKMREIQTSAKQQMESYANKMLPAEQETTHDK